MLFKKLNFKIYRKMLMSNKILKNNNYLLLVETIFRFIENTIIKVEQIEATWIGDRTCMI